MLKFKSAKICKEGCRCVYMYKYNCKCLYQCSEVVYVYVIVCTRTAACATYIRTWCILTNLLKALRLVEWGQKLRI